MTKILIVEDEAGLRQGLEINLRLENYETVQAGDGEEAIRLFHSEQPDLILLDLMPVSYTHLTLPTIYSV